MLTILNHHLLANKPVGKLGWVVEYCLEKKYRVSVFVVNKSFSIGTEEEWLTLSYWQESFSDLGQFE